MLRKNPCRMPRFASPVASTATVPSCSCTLPPICSRVPSPATRRRPISSTCWFSASSIGPSLASGVVEQLQVELLDPRADHAGDRHRRARRRRGRCRSATAVVNGDSRGSKKRRYGIERRVLEPHRHLGVHPVGQREPAGAGDGQTRRGGFELGGQQLAAQRQPAGDLADAFVAGEQIVDARPSRRSGARRSCRRRSR